VENLQDVEEEFLHHEEELPHLEGELPHYALIPN